jgi:hypothetical protein
MKGVEKWRVAKGGKISFLERGVINIVLDQNRDPFINP